MFIFSALLDDIVRYWTLCICPQRSDKKSKQWHAKCIDENDDNNNNDDDNNDNNNSNNYNNNYDDDDDDKTIVYDEMKMYITPTFFSMNSINYVLLLHYIW